MTQTILGSESPTAVPQPKVLNPLIAGALIAVIIWIVQQFKPDFTMPEAIVAAFTALIMFIAGYLTPPNGFTGETRTLPGDTTTKLSIAIVMLTALTALSACTPSGQLSIPMVNDPRSSWTTDCSSYAGDLQQLAANKAKLSAFEVRLVDQQREVIGPLCPPRRQEAPTSTVELQALSRSAATLSELRKEVSKR